MENDEDEGFDAFETAKVSSEVTNPAQPQVNNNAIAGNLNQTINLTTTQTTTVPTVGVNVVAGMNNTIHGLNNIGGVTNMSVMSYVQPTGTATNGTLSQNGMMGGGFPGQFGNMGNTGAMGNFGGNFGGNNMMGMNAMGGMNGAFGASNPINNMGGMNGNMFGYNMQQNQYLMQQQQQQLLMQQQMKQQQLMQQQQNMQKQQQQPLKGENIMAMYGGVQKMY